MTTLLASLRRIHPVTDTALALHSLNSATIHKLALASAAILIALVIAILLQLVKDQAQRFSSKLKRNNQMSFVVKWGRER